MGAKMRKSKSFIRPKATQRKRRSGSDQGVLARQPTQDRSIQRFEEILKAAEDLLQTANIEDLSFYDIARQAELPPASVHYLFPTVAAVRIELGKRYLEETSEFVLGAQGALAAQRNPTWQEWVKTIAVAFRDHLNANRPIAEVTLGPELHRLTRIYRIGVNERAAKALVENMDAVFLLPEIPGLETKFIYVAEMVDALWSRAYIKYGQIDDQSLDEAVAMQISYLRTILPEVLILRRPRD